MWSLARNKNSQATPTPTVQHLHLKRSQEILVLIAQTVIYKEAEISGLTNKFISHNSGG